jgi:hypothetical protein
MSKEESWILKCNRLQRKLELVEAQLKASDIEWYGKLEAADAERYAAEAQLSEVRKLLDYFDECSRSGFVSVTNPYTHCRNLLQAILESDNEPRGN